MRVGVDLGGTKIEALALDPDGRELLRRRVPTPSGDYGAVLLSIAGLVEGFERELKVRFPHVGIGTPGSISPSTGVIQNSNSTCLIGRPLDRDLEKALGRPVRMANDADCFALSEAVDGAGKDGGTVFGVILGTGVGGGFVVGKKLLKGRNAIAGEWGHNPLPWQRDDERPGGECYCGKRGCIETFLSGPGMSKEHERRTGEKKDAKELAKDPAVLELYEDRLARALVSIMNVVDPDVIVLGGGLSNIDRLYEGVPKVWGRYVFTGEPTTELRKAKYGDSSGVRGAAWL